jgi:hypothetical protein
MQKVTDYDLTMLETQKNALIVQSDFANIVVAFKKRLGLWIIDKDTRAEIPIHKENALAFADELTTMIHVHLL